MTWLHWPLRAKELGLIRSGTPALLVGAGILLGLMLTVQTSSRSAVKRASRTYSADLSVQTVLNLRAEQQELRSQLQQLRAEFSDLQKEAAGSQGNLQELQSQIEEQRQLVGLTALRGPGVIVTLDDSDNNVAPDDPNLNRYVIHQQQLVTVIGVLWTSGAEAIAINDQRITDQSSIYCVGSTIVVNQELLSPPFYIQAIGNPPLLAEAVQTSPLLADLWRRQAEYGISVDVTQERLVNIPAYTGYLATQHMELAP